MVVKSTYVKSIVPAIDDTEHNILAYIVNIDYTGIYSAHFLYII